MSTPDVGIAGDRRRDPVGLGAEEHAGQVDRVAPDVHQRPAAELADVADVGRVVVEVREPAAARRPGRRCGRCRTISTAACQLGWSRYMNASMNFTSASAHASTMRSASAEVERQRLLAQDVLAGVGGADRPLGVEVVGQRDVDGVDRRVVEQVLVRAVGAPDRRADRLRPGWRRCRARRWPRPRSWERPGWRGSPSGCRCWPSTGRPTSPSSSRWILRPGRSLADPTASLAALPAEGRAGDVLH